MQGVNVEGEEDGGPGNAAWKQQVSKGLKDISWPPPEATFDKFANELEGRSRIQVAQWPPPEFEEKEIQDVQIQQTNFARQKKAVVWPPVRPGEEEQELGDQPRKFNS